MRCPNCRPQRCRRGAPSLPSAAHTITISNVAYADTSHTGVKEFFYAVGFLVDRGWFKTVTVMVEPGELPPREFQCKCLSGGEDCRSFCYMAILKKGPKLCPELKDLNKQSASVDPLLLNDGLAITHTDWRRIEVGSLGNSEELGIGHLYLIGNGVEQEEKRKVSLITKIREIVR